MDRPNDAQTPARNANKDSKSKQRGAGGQNARLYLIIYNSVSALPWAILLGRVVQFVLHYGYLPVFDETIHYVTWVQTLAVMEILHAALGIVRAPLLTTVMQVSSRLLLVWGIAFFYPFSTKTSPAFTSMLLAWSTTEVVRYSYFAVNLTNGSVPKWLTWLRYNAFFVLYPLGISSECWLVWRAVEPAKASGYGVQWALIAVLAIYVPGSYILFTHMMAQRRKVMRALSNKSS